MLNDTQAADSDRSIMVKFADNSSVLIKKTHRQTPQEVETILSWTLNNIMTINLTKTKEKIVKGKVERPLLIVTFDNKQEVFLKLLGVYFYSNPRLGKANRCSSQQSGKAYAHITSVQEEWI